jgi:putative methanogenesis marker protein 3
MITIHLDGEQTEVAEGAMLASLLKNHPPGCCAAIIRPSTKEERQTGSLSLSTTAGEITIEVAGEDAPFFGTPEITDRLAIHWTDRYAAAFGPFPTPLRPARRPHLYEQNDVILGCGGYDPKKSYLIFSKSRHSADHGSDETGGIIGKVVSGRAVLDRWTTGDRIEKITPVVSWADTSRSFTTGDPGLVLEDGMQVVTHVDILAQGYTAGNVTTEAAGTVEHLLLALSSGKFRVGRAASTHILDERLTGSDVPEQYKRPRREGTVTVRTHGRSSGGVYIYRSDVSASPAHSVVGQVVHGIELVKLAKENDLFVVNVQPRRIDMLGLPLPAAKEIAAGNGLAFTVDNETGERIVVSQEPGTTLDALNEKAVSVTTAPLAKVIDLELDDEAAPDSCEVFRRITGLREHDAGVMPLFFKFDDSFLFKPAIPKEVRLHPENVPKDEVPAAALGITNDSRKGAGIVGVRLSANKEFGPTSEPFEGTNIIGKVIDTAKLKGLRERDKVYIREVRK